MGAYALDSASRCHGNSSLDLAYLASRRNGYVTGVTVNVDGGSDFV